MSPEGPRAVAAAASPAVARTRAAKDDQGQNPGLASDNVGPWALNQASPAAHWTAVTTRICSTASLVARTELEWRYGMMAVLASSPGLLSQWISLDPKHPCPLHTMRRASELEKGPVSLSTSGYKEVQSPSCQLWLPVGRDHHKHPLLRTTQVPAKRTSSRTHPSSHKPHHVCSGLLP